MVLILYKKTDHNQFLYECPGQTLVKDLVSEVVESIFLLIT